MAISAQKTRYVIVATETRSVWFGDLAPSREPLRVVLRNARCCVYWSADVRGFAGLAIIGPSEKCRVTGAVDRIEIRNATVIVDAKPEAVGAWNKAPWAC